MSKTYDFLKECTIFNVLTINHGLPAGRPFGAVMEHNTKLYISTSDTKEVYKQIISNSNIQIMALKPGTRDWIRVNGRAEECTDLSLKQKMLEECPVITKHFTSADSEHYVLFTIEIIDSYLTVDNQLIKLD